MALMATVAHGVGIPLTRGVQCMGQTGCRTTRRTLLALNGRRMMTMSQVRSTASTHILQTTPMAGQMGSRTHRTKARTAVTLTTQVCRSSGETGCRTTQGPCQMPTKGLAGLQEGTSTQIPESRPGPRVAACRQKSR